MERVRVVLPFVVAALIAGSALAQPHLVFDHSIGAERKPDEDGWMNFVAISRDGLTAVSNWNAQGNMGGELAFWAFPGGKFLRGVPGTALAISEDFAYLATATSVLNLQMGKSVFGVSQMGDWLTTAAFSSEGKYVAFVDDRAISKQRRGRIVVLNTSDGAEVSRFGNRFTGALAFHPDDATLASGHWNRVTLWNAATGARLALLTGNPKPVSAASDGYSRDGSYIRGIGFSRNGSLLAAGTDDGELQIWDFTNRKLLRSLKIGGLDVSNPAFSPDGRLVAAGTYGDGTVTLVDVASGKILSQIQVSMFGCGSVAFSPDGAYLVTPSNGGTLNDGKHVRGGTIRVFRVVE